MFYFLYVFFILLYTFVNILAWNYFIYIKKQVVSNSSLNIEG
jgi:hypothetical protein